MYVIDAVPDDIPDHHPTGPTVPDLDSADTDTSAVGREPSPPPDTARDRARRIAARTDRNTLAAVHHAQREAHLHIHRAEAKATALVGVFAAGLAAALIEARTITTDPARWLAVAAALPLLTAVGVLLSVLATRLADQHAPGVRRWALYREHPDALAHDVDLPVRRQIRAQAGRLGALSAAAVSRIRRITLAVWLLLAGLALLTLAALAA